MKNARRTLALGGAALVALMLSVGATVAVADSSGGTVTYTATQTIPVPPASKFPGSSGGGDGWSVALSNTQVFNVFHHQSYLGVECHNQSDGSTCWPNDPTYITDGSGNNFATSGQPGIYLDQAEGKLYVYATRSNDDTAGVVCVDVSNPTANPTFCGFTALSSTGDGYVSGNGGLSDPMVVGTRLYSFNYYPGDVTGTRDELLCFDLTTDAACAGQPFAVNLGLASGATMAVGNFPSPATAAVNNKLFIPVADSDGNQLLACWDPSTGTDCAGSWPLSLKSTDYYASGYGPAFAMLDTTGNEIGLCLPSPSAPCFDYSGASVATPTNLASALAGNDPVGWNGPGVVVGPRVYLPQWYSDVACFDYSTDAACSGFPKSFSNAGGLYTVNADPQRPSCLWINSDDGSEQIQDFDAFTGGACGQGAIRVLASQFVVPQKACFPSSYDSLQITDPAASTYDTSGAPNGSSITFEDADGNPIAGIGTQYLDGTGSVNLAGLNLNGPLGLPQFLISLANSTSPVTSVTVKLKWEDTFDSACTSTSVTATAPATPPVPAPVTTVTTTSTPVVASKPAVYHCPAAAGALTGTTVGVFSIGMTQTQARQTLEHYNVTKNKFDNFCLFAGWGIRLGYPTPALLKSISASQRASYTGHVVLALTANPFYTLNGVKPGMSIASVSKSLHAGKPFHVGSNDWYFVPAGAETGVLKVRHGVIQEVGLASLALTKTRALQRVFINSLNKLM
jgi:hypothetical protein